MTYFRLIDFVRYYFKIRQLNYSELSFGIVDDIGSSLWGILIQNQFGFLEMLICEFSKVKYTPVYTLISRRLTMFFRYFCSFGGFIVQNNSLNSKENFVHFSTEITQKNEQIIQ